MLHDNHLIINCLVWAVKTRKQNKTMLSRQTTPSQRVSCKWYVLTHWDASRFRKWLEAENARRLDEGSYFIESFFPYDFLSKRKPHAAGATDMINGSGKKDNVQEDFLNFIFLRGTEKDIDGIVNGEWNMSFIVRLHYYKNVEGRHATVPDREMKDFIHNCHEYRGFFELRPHVSDIVPMDHVEILSGPFAGYEADVVRATHSKGSVHLELRVGIASGILNVHIKNVRSNQVARLDSGSSVPIHDDFIERSQNKILSVYEHRVKRVNDAATRLADVRKLNEMFHYNLYTVENKSAHAHFRALMLICAHLRQDRQAENVLREEVSSLLEDLNRQSPSKANTDARTYLWIALYISTGDPSFRDAAKDYVKTQDPKSAKLRKFVSLMRKGKKV